LATEEWLTSARQQKAEETIRNYRSFRNRWLEFCEERDIDSMADVPGRTFMEFKIWRAEDVALATVGQNLSRLRSFIRHCEKVEIVPKGLLDRMPDVTAGDGTRDEKVDEATAEAVLTYLRRFEYASRRYAVFAFIWHTACRTGAVRSIDLPDCRLGISEPYIELAHRPETDTPLKNCEASEREVNLSGALLNH